MEAFDCASGCSETLQVNTVYHLNMCISNSEVVVYMMNIY